MTVMCRFPGRLNWIGVVEIALSCLLCSNTVAKSTVDVTSFPGTSPALCRILYHFYVQYVTKSRGGVLEQGYMVDELQPHQIKAAIPQTLTPLMQAMEFLFLE